MAERRLAEGCASEFLARATDNFVAAKAAVAKAEERLRRGALAIEAVMYEHGIEVQVKVDQALAVFEQSITRSRRRVGRR